MEVHSNSEFEFKDERKDIQRYATRGRSCSISLATRRIGAICCRDEGTTSLSKTSVVTVAATLREGRLINAGADEPPVSVDCVDEDDAIALLVFFPVDAYSSLTFSLSLQYPYTIHHQNIIDSTKRTPNLHKNITQKIEKTNHSTFTVRSTV